MSQGRADKPNPRLERYLDVLRRLNRARFNCATIRSMRLDRRDRVLVATAIQRERAAVELEFSDLEADTKACIRAEQLTIWEQIRREKEPSREDGGTTAHHQPARRGE